VVSLRKAEWILALVSLAFGVVLLFGGLVFLYWGMWHILGYATYGTRPAGLEFLFSFWGVLLVTGGIFLTLYPGKKLEGKHLVVISLTHLIAAPSAIYLVFSILDPHWVYVFLHPTILSNIPLDIGLLLGYSVERRSKNKQDEALFLSLLI